MNTQKIRTRNWFLTINQNAECFNSVRELVESYNKCEYALILHDKDNEEQPHYHLCIMFDNARIFEHLQKKFVGAHIEQMESKYKCFRYLLHLDDKEKYQYELSEVLQRGNCVEYYITHDEYIKLDTESVLENIANGNITCLLDAVKLFGIKQTNLYKNIIVELINSRELEKNVVSKDDYLRLSYELEYQQHLYDDICENLVSLRLENDKLTEINNKLLVQIREYEKWKGGLI